MYDCIHWIGLDATTLSELSEEKYDDIFASTSASDGVDGETISIGSIVLHWMVLRLGSTNDLWANSAMHAPPKQSKTMDHMMSSFV